MTEPGTARSGPPPGADAPDEGEWVFGYGSLMWRPGFDYMQQAPAEIAGYHRAFCRISLRHRGTPVQPGMVVGLEPGGACQGVAFLLARERVHDILAYLDEREGAAYRRQLLQVRVETPQGSRDVPAWTYVPDRTHSTHHGQLPRERMVQLVATGVGVSGSARDYLAELIEQLERLGVSEPWLKEMLRDVDAYRQQLGLASATTPAGGP